MNLAVNSIYPKRIDSIVADSFFTISESRIELEGNYTFTLLYSNQEGERTTMNRVFKVEVIDNPCIGGFGKPSNLDTEGTISKGTTVIDLSGFSNSDCEFEIMLKYDNEGTFEQSIDENYVIT